MDRKIKVRVTLVPKNVMVKYAVNKNVVAKMPLHPQITGWPHTADEYDAVCEEVYKEAQLQLKGDRSATKRLHKAEDKMDLYYYDIASHVETYANKLKEASLPASMGLVLWATPKARKRKSFQAANGETEKSIVLTFPRNVDAAAYIAEIAEVIDGQEPYYELGGGNSTTIITIVNKKRNTDYLIRLSIINATGIIPYLNTISFHTRK